MLEASWKALEMVSRSNSGLYLVTLRKSSSMTSATATLLWPASGPRSSTPSRNGTALPAPTSNPLPEPTTPPTREVRHEYPKPYDWPQYDLPSHSFPPAQRDRVPPSNISDGLTPCAPHVCASFPCRRSNNESARHSSSGLQGAQCDQEDTADPSRLRALCPQATPRAVWRQSNP